MNVKKQLSVLLGVILLGVIAVGATATSAAAEPAHTSAVERSKAYADWSREYEKTNGDRSVPVFLNSSRRGLSTEDVAAHGFVELDLIAGRALVELKGLTEAVDVWLVDNKPGPGRSILPEDGDVVIHLARMAPGEGGGVVSVERDFGPEALRGVEVNWIIVARAGEPPAQSRLLYGTRSYFELLYTRQRLAREGFVESTPPRPEPAAKAPTKAGPPIATRPHKVLVATGLVSQDVFDGADVFFREIFEGNGRTCGSCHPAENNQTIEKAFIATLPASDKLFIAEQVPPGHPIANLERPPLMREFGLILENVDGLENPNVKFLMRSVPHSLSLATSILAPPGQTTPFEDRTGWSGDGAPPPGRLIEFTLGAITQHFPKNSLARIFKENAPPGIPFDFRLPTDDELHVNNEFMLSCGRLNELDLNAVVLTNERADNGVKLFVNNACNGCHFNASANVNAGTNPNPNFNFNTLVELIPNPAQGFMGINFPLDGGFLGQGLAFPNRDCNNDGVLDCFGDGTFNTTPLIEAADTGPFFHNNTSLTIEAAVDFYNNPPFQVVNFTDAEVDDVAGFLRVVNASFNLALAMQRDEAVLVIDPYPALSFVEANAIRGTANKLLLLSNEEIRDALDVLTNGPLGDIDPKATTLAKEAHALNEKAIVTSSVTTRAKLIKLALSYLKEANAHLGTGMDFKLGEGNLLF